VTGRRTSRPNEVVRALLVHLLQQLLLVRVVTHATRVLKLLSRANDVPLATLDLDRVGEGHDGGCCSSILLCVADLDSRKFARHLVHAEAMVESSTTLGVVLLVLVRHGLVGALTVLGRGALLRKDVSTTANLRLRPGRGRALKPTVGVFANIKHPL
jgi:hypothetical protein